MDAQGSLEKEHRGRSSMEEPSRLFSLDVSMKGTRDITGTEGRVLDGSPGAVGLAGRAWPWYREYLSQDSSGLVGTVLFAHCDQEERRSDA